MNTDCITFDPTELNPLGSVHSCYESSSTHHVFDRTLVQSMPEDWQRRYVALRREYDAAHAAIGPIDYRVETGIWRYPAELDHSTRSALKITHNVQGWACEQHHGHDQDCDPDECDPHQTATWVYYDARGEQIQGAGVFLRSPDPVIQRHWRRTGTVDLGETWRGYHQVEQVRQLLALHRIAAGTGLTFGPEPEQAAIADTVVVHPVTRLAGDTAADWIEIATMALTTVPGWMVTPPPTAAEREAYGAALAVQLPDARPGMDGQP